MGPWLLSILKSIGKFLLPIFIEEIKDWIVEYFKRRKKLKEEAKEIEKKAEEAKKEVTEAVKPGMTDEERIAAQKSAWARFVKWFGSK
jgi:hypothetical protein